MTSNQDKSKKSKSRETNNCRWISSGFENYLADLTNNDIAGSPDKPIDFLIIGSGYGAAIAARELSRQFAQTGSSEDPTQGGCKEIVIFERGEEYLPGSFPDNFSELPTHLRISPTQTHQLPGRKRAGWWFIDQCRRDATPTCACVQRALA